jgi:hypothetical protein
MFSEKQQSTKNDYSFSVVKDPEQKDGDVSPYFPANIAGLEGFTFIGDGYPLLEMGGNAPCYSKIPNPQTQIGISRSKNRNRDTKEESVEEFADYGEAHYNALFPRPSIRDGRMRDIRDMVIVDNSLYLIGSVTIVTLLVGGLVIASFNKTA